MAATDRTDPHDRLINHLPRLVSIGVLATELGLSERHIHRLIERGSLRAHKLSPRQQGGVRVARDSVADWLRATSI